MRLEIRLLHVRLHVRTCAVTGINPAVHGADDLVPPPVVHRQVDGNGRVAGGLGGDPVDLPLYILGQSGNVPDGNDPNIVVPVEGVLSAEVARQERHEEGDLPPGTTPVLAGECVKCEILDPEADRLQGHALSRFHTLPVPLGAGKPAARRPAPVAVHDNPDVSWYRRCRFTRRPRLLASALLLDHLGRPSPCVAFSRPPAPPHWAEPTTDCTAKHFVKQSRSSKWLTKRAAPARDPGCA